MSQNRANYSWDEQGRPFVTLPSTLELRLTPYDPSYIADLVTLLNDPTIGRWSFRRPYPYHAEHNEWYTKSKKDDWASGTEVLRRIDTDSPRPAGNFPLCYLKYLPVDGDTGLLSKLVIRSGQIIGDLYFFPYTSTDEETEEMLSRKPEDQMWEVAYDLLPSVQGRGIGYRLLSTGLDVWADKLGIGKVVATVEEANVASRALVRKCGFVEMERFITPWPADKGGGERKTIRFVRTHPKRT